MPRSRYPTDLSDKEWAILEPLIPPPKSGGRPCKYSRREIVNAIFYVLRTGCQWRALPHDFPDWQAVYHYFRKWKQLGHWETIHEYLRRKLRMQMGRQPEASAGIMDSQSVKITEKGGFMATIQSRKLMDVKDIF